MIIPIYQSLDTLLHTFFGENYNEFEFILESSERNCRIPLTYTLSIKVLTGNKVTLSNNFQKNSSTSIAEAAFNSFVQSNLEQMMVQRFEYFNLLRP